MRKKIREKNPDNQRLKQFKKKTLKTNKKI